MALDIFDNSQLFMIITETRKGFLKKNKLFLYFATNNSYASQFWQISCKLISIILISFNDFMKGKGFWTKYMQ